MKTALRPTLLSVLFTAAAAAQATPQWVLGGQTVLTLPGAAAVQVTGVNAHIAVIDRAAVTTLEIALYNPGPRPQEAVLLLPVPEGAAVSGFAFDGQAAEAATEVLDQVAARQLYDSITRKVRDPALLEFVDCRCLRSSVFPVPAHGRQRLRVVLDQVLEVDGSRVDYLLPRSEALTCRVPWSVTVDLRSKAPIGLCYSPSHEFLVTRRGDHALRAYLATAKRLEPGPFRFCYTTLADPARPSATLFAYPDPTVGGGYFLLLVQAPPPAPGAPLRREVTLVIDRSGSMAGRKLDQAKAAARQILAALGDGEGIQVIDYGNSVSAAFAAPLPKDATTTAAALQYIDAIRPIGGTNMHDALVEALRAPTLPGTLPLVLFLTDGLPTVGPTREADLRRVVAAGNPQDRRVFCFGVGHDVNAPLLDRIAESTRAASVYVAPEEDVEHAVARAFSRLERPVLAAPNLAAVDAGQRVTEVLPAKLPDVYAGEQIVVLGQYRGGDDLRFRLDGDGACGRRQFAFTLPVRTASTRHAFVPRLWATRQIAFLVDELRQRGGDLGGGSTAMAANDPFRDPRLRELRDEILRLSTRFGVLGEYTAFLAREGSDLGDWRALTADCGVLLQDRAIAMRSGIAAVNQAHNLRQQKHELHTNYANAFVDQHLRRVETAEVQQICDRAFFRRGDRWIDGRSVLNGSVAPMRRVEFDSQPYHELRGRLEREGRGGVLSLRGEILLELDGQNVLITPVAPKTEEVHR